MKHPTVPAPRFDVSEAEALERTEAFARRDGAAADGP